MEYKITEKMTKERIDEIFKVKEKNGLTPETLLQQAKKRNSNLHELFEWDDTIAGQQWRLQQARVLINEVKVIIDQQEMYAFESVCVQIEDSADTNREYKSIYDIKSDIEYKRQVIESAYRQLMYWKQKYQAYSEFSDVIESIIRLEKTKVK